MTSNDTKISFLGFGEAAQAFATGFLQDGAAVTLRAYDIKTDGSDADIIRSTYAACGVAGGATPDEVCADAQIIVSLVTADQAANAAAAAARGPLGNALFFDCNSCAPDTKRRSARIIEAAGGRYVDVAIMTPVHPRLHKSPCLIAGPHAAQAYDTMQALGMSVEISGDAVGQASTRKMIRSVLIKGLEALTVECFLAARTAGIETDILDSLETSFPGFDWQSRAPYMIERAATHGIRRAAEMDEVAQTLRDLGLEPLMTERTVLRQRQMGDLGLTVKAQDAKDLAKLTDQVLTALSSTNQTSKKET